MPTTAPRRVTHALLTALALVLVTSCAAGSTHVAPAVPPVLTRAERDELTAELATLPDGLTREMPVDDAVATFRGTLADGARVDGLVTWSDTDCSVAAVGGPFGDGSLGASRVGGLPGAGRTDAEYPTDDLLSATVDGTGWTRIDGPPGTASLVVECGRRGVHVTLDPQPADLEVTGAASVVAYENGFPLGLVVGSRSVRWQAGRAADGADAPDPAILSLPRLPLADDRVGILTPGQRAHVVATFEADGLSGAVALDGTSCSVSVTGPDQAGSGLVAEPDLRTTNVAQNSTVLLGGGSMLVADDVSVGFTCARSGAAVRLVDVPAQDVTVHGSAAVVETTSAAFGGASAVVVVGTPPAIRATVDAADA